MIKSIHLYNLTTIHQILFRTCRSFLFYFWFEYNRMLKHMCSEQKLNRQCSHYYYYFKQRHGTIIITRSFRSHFGSRVKATCAKWLWWWLRCASLLWCGGASMWDAELESLTPDASLQAQATIDDAEAPASRGTPTVKKLRRPAAARRNNISKRLQQTYRQYRNTWLKLLEHAENQQSVASGVIFPCAVTSDNFQARQADLARRKLRPQSKPSEHKRCGIGIWQNELLAASLLQPIMPSAH